MALAAKQVRKAQQRISFQRVSKARTNKFDIFRQYTYIVYLSILHNKTQQNKSTGKLGFYTKFLSYHNNQIIILADIFFY